MTLSIGGRQSSVVFRVNGSGQLANGSVVGGGRQAKVRLETHLGPLDCHSWRPRLSLKRQKDNPFLESPHSPLPSSPAPSP